MDSSLKKIHQKLNKIYLRAEKDYHKLLAKEISCQLLNFNNNYIKIDGQDQLQKYLIPIISFQSGGDLGYNLDKIFFESAFNLEEFLSLDLAPIFSEYREIEIYGGRDCQIDFYEKGDTNEIVKEKVRASSEDTIMVSIYFDYDQKNLLDKVISIEGMAKSLEVSSDAYNEMAEHYFHDVDTKPFNAYYERPATLLLLPDVRDKKVLDAGCAAGWYTGWLINQGAEVTAIDFSPEMIKMTEKRVGDKARIIQADLNQPLDFIKDKELDLIISSLTLHYLKDWEPVMDEFNRILKQAGRLVFSVHHPFMDFTYFKRENYFKTELLTDEWNTKRGKVEVQFYRRPLNKIISPVLKAGFQLEELLEPMPTEKFRERAPETYERLTKKPQFLFIKAKKYLDN